MVVFVRDNAAGICYTTYDKFNQAFDAWTVQGKTAILPYEPPKRKNVPNTGALSPVISYRALLCLS